MICGCWGEEGWSVSGDCLSEMAGLRWLALSDGLGHLQVHGPAPSVCE